MNEQPSPDRSRIYGAVAVRSFAYGMIGVLLGLYLDALGYGGVRVGVLLTAALVGGALLTLGVSLWADRGGRRRTLMVLATLASIGAVAFALWPVFVVLLVVALTGAINPTGKDRGAFSALEQAALPQVSSSQSRNWVFARYNLVSGVMAALGALSVSLAGLIQRWGAMDPLEVYKGQFLVYAGLALVLVLVYSRLSGDVEPEMIAERRLLFPRVRSKGIVGGLSGLFALDAFGGGLVVQSYLAYWFHVRFGMDAGTLGMVFFASGVLTSLSYLAAARLAQRIGLLNTMVFSHLPSNVLLLLVPLAPVWWLALGLFLARETLSQMDVPTRQSYMVAVVRPEERTATTGFTTLSRNAAQSASPSLGGFLMQSVGLASPLLLAGSLKIVYDLAILAAFRRVKPPEERKADQG